MILGEPHASQAASGDGATLDDLFRWAAGQRPDAIALADPPNRKSFTDDSPLRLTYAEVDRAASAAATRLRRLDLAPDSVVALQLPNTVEAVIMLLGVLRAGLIAAPLPLLWRRADTVTALSRVGAKAIVTAAHVGAVDYGSIAAHVAAELFPIRFVFGFGANLPEGIVPLDDIFSPRQPDPLPPVERETRPAAHVALVTWDITADGIVPLARSHDELIAGGLAVALEGRLAPQAAILGACALSSFPGLAMTVLPWLLTGGTLSLHHPFDSDVLAAQCRSDRCDTVVVPGPLVPRLTEAGVFAAEGLRTVLSFWRAPERLPASAAWLDPAVGLVDVAIFGETALIGTRRGADGRAAALPLGAVTAPRGADNAERVSDLIRTDTGTIAVRGPMVPLHPYPPGAERGTAPFFRVGHGGFVDTRYPCRINWRSDAVEVTAPPPGIVSVGGYRFLLNDLQDLVRHRGGGAALTALPDALAGQRLAGRAADRETLRTALTSIGVNPLVVDAFRGRRRTPEAA